MSRASARPGARSTKSTKPVATARLASSAGRLVACAALGIAVFAAAMAVVAWQVAVLVGWDATGIAFVGWVFWSVRGKDGAATKALVAREDSSRAAADVVLVSASLGTLIAMAAGKTRCPGARHARGRPAADARRAVATGFVDLVERAPGRAEAPLNGTGGRAAPAGDRGSR